MTRSKERVILFGLALAFGALLLVELVLFVSASHQRRASGWVARSRDKREQLTELVTCLTEAETGRRGFMLSGQPPYWGHYTGKVAQARLALRDLRQKVADNPRHLSMYQQLEPRFFQCLAILTNSMNAHQAGRLNGPEQIAAMEQGTRAVESVRDIVQQMVAEETTRLKERQALQKANSDGTKGLALLVSLVSLMLLVTLSVLFVRANRRRSRAEEGLRQTNAELEQRVQERTAELSRNVILLRTLIDALPDMVFTKDPQGRFSMCNAALLRNVGLSDEQEFLGKSVFDLHPRELAKRYHDDDLQALSGQSVLNCEEPGIDSSGQPRWFLTTKVPLRDPEGVIIGMVGTSRDITERKKQEEALRESEERFRTLTESLPQLVWTCQPDGACDYLSRQWIEYTGRPAVEQLGYGWAEHVHPDDRPRVTRAWAEAIQHGNFFDVEFRIRRADGVYRWFKTRAVPWRDNTGSIVKWFGSNTDFEDYKRSEQHLHTQLERLNLLDQTTRAISERQNLESIFQVVVRSLEDHLPVEFACVCTYDAVEQTLTVKQVGDKSQAFARDLGLTRQARLHIDHDGLERCLHGHLVYEPDVKEVPAAFAQRMTRGGLRSLVVAPLLVESQVFGILVAARKKAQSFSSGECEFLRQLSGHVALAAHQAQLYDALEQAYNELRQSQQVVMQHERLRALGQMASGIAHDINNAISPVALYTESLLDREPNLSPRARDYLQTIRQAIRDVAETVARMREFSRPREPQLSLARVHLAALAHQVLELTRARWDDILQQRGTVIQVRTEFADDLAPVLGVESELREALTNLVFNALDAMPEGGTLTFRTSPCAARGKSWPGTPESARVCVEISDTGVGMDEDTRRRCMEPFFTTKGERGTGLGLAMVYGVVQRHGAGIEINSRPGEGTTIRLDFAAAELVEDEGSQPPIEDPIPPRLRILVVDDDPMLVKSLRDTLENDGHVVVAAGGGQEGIDLFRAARDTEPFAVVITDLGMPHVDGRRVAQEVKNLSPSTPVILLTGWGQRLVAEGSVPPHVDRVLNKPPRLPELREALLDYCCAIRP